MDDQRPRLNSDNLSFEKEILPTDYPIEEEPAAAVVSELQSPLQLENELSQEPLNYAKMMADKIIKTNNPVDVANAVFENKSAEYVADVAGGCYSTSKAEKIQDLVTALWGLWKNQKNLKAIIIIAVAAPKDAAAAQTVLSAEMRIQR